MDDSKLITIDQAAQMFGVTPRRIYVYMDEQSLPVVVRSMRGTASKRTLFDPGALHEWGLQRYLRGLGEGEVSLQHEKALLTKAQRLKAELDLEERAGQVVKAAVVERFIQDEYARARARLLALPAKLAGLIEGMDIEQRRDTIESSVRDALIELSDTSPFAPRVDDEAGLDATTEADTEPVGGPVSDAQLGGERGTGSVDD